MSSRDQYNLWWQLAHQPACPFTLFWNCILFIFHFLHPLNIFHSHVYSLPAINFFAICFDWLTSTARSYGLWIPFCVFFVYSHLFHLATLVWLDVIRCCWLHMNGNELFSLSLDRCNNVLGVKQKTEHQYEWSIEVDASACPLEFKTIKWRCGEWIPNLAIW